MQVLKSFENILGNNDIGNCPTSLAAYFNVMFPVSVYITCWMITFYFIGGTRFIVRITRSIKAKKRKNTHKKRIMIIGAGDTASLLIKETKNNSAAYMSR